jgi:hypothetical protein
MTNATGDIQTYVPQEGQQLWLDDSFPQKLFRRMLHVGGPAQVTHLHFLTYENIYCENVLNYGTMEQSNTPVRVLNVPGRSAGSIATVEIDIPYLLQEREQLLRHAETGCTRGLDKTPGIPQSVSRNLQKLCPGGQPILEMIRGVGSYYYARDDHHTSSGAYSGCCNPVACRDCFQTEHAHIEGECKLCTRKYDPLRLSPQFDRTIMQAEVPFSMDTTLSALGLKFENEEYTGDMPMSVFIENLLQGDESIDNHDKVQPKSIKLGGHGNDYQMYEIPVPPVIKTIKPSSQASRAGAKDGWELVELRCESPPHKDCMQSNSQQKMSTSWTAVFQARIDLRPVQRIFDVHPGDYRLSYLWGENPYDVDPEPGNPEFVNPMLRWYNMR